MKDATWFLVRYILMHATDHVWYRNSNCIEMRLADSGVGIGVKISVFDSRYKHKDGELVHSHYSDFKSRIVAGVMRQQRYVEVTAGEVECVGEDPFEGCIPCICQAFDIDRKPVTPTPVKVWLKELPEETQRAGEEYSIISPELHRTWPDDGTVTLRITEFKTPRTGIKIFWRPGEEPRKGTGKESEVKIVPDGVPATMVNDIITNSLQTWF